MTCWHAKQLVISDFVWPRPKTFIQEPKCPKCQAAKKCVAQKQRSNDLDEVSWWCRESFFSPQISWRFKNRWGVSGSPNKIHSFVTFPYSSSHECFLEIALFDSEGIYMPHGKLDVFRINCDLHTFFLHLHAPLCWPLGSLFLASRTEFTWKSDGMLFLLATFLWWCWMYMWCFVEWEFLLVVFLGLKTVWFWCSQMLDTILTPTPHVSEKPAAFTMLESIFISSCPSCLTLRFQSGGGSNACHSSSSVNMVLVYQHEKHIKVNLKVLYTASSLSSCNSWNINVSQKTSTSNIKPL